MLTCTSFCWLQSPAKLPMFMQPYKWFSWLSALTIAHVRVDGTGIPANCEPEHYYCDVLQQPSDMFQGRGLPVSNHAASTSTYGIHNTYASNPPHDALKHIAHTSNPMQQRLADTKHVNQQGLRCLHNMETTYGVYRGVSVVDTDQQKTASRSKPCAGTCRQECYSGYACNKFVLQIWRSWCLSCLLDRLLGRPPPHCQVTVTRQHTAW